MEFVDYKCLESLIIEGEGIIATEGFVDKIKNAWKAIGKFVKPIIRTILKTIGDIGKNIWGCITGLGKKKSDQNDESKSKSQREFASTCYDSVMDFIFKFVDVSFTIGNIGLDIGNLINWIGNNDEKLTENINDTNHDMDSLNNLISELNQKFQKSNLLENFL